MANQKNQIMTQPTMTTTTNNMKPLFENIGGNQFKLSEDGEMSDYDRGHYENGGRMVGTRRNQQHAEDDMNNSEEKREVQIGRGILQSLKLIQQSLPKQTHPNVTSELQSIGVYAQELIKMHGQQPE